MIVFPCIVTWQVLAVLSARKFYLLVYGLFKFRYHCLNVRLGTLISGLIGRFVFQMKLSLNQWLGMGIALTGLSVICLGDADQHIQPIGIVIALVGVLVYCVSMFWVKKINAPIDPMAQAAGSIGLSVVFSIGMLPFISQYAPTAMPHAKSLFGLMYAVIMASLIAMFCYFKLVQKIKPTTLSLTTVLTPMLALLVGVLLNNENCRSLLWWV